VRSRGIRWKIGFLQSFHSGRLLLLLSFQQRNHELLHG
jgi:hypothetical protein